MIVDTIQVIGTVNPRSASVTVAGRQEQPSGSGRFYQVLRLHPGLNEIAVVAQAPGYAGQRTEIAVTYSPPSSGASAPARDAPGASGSARDAPGASGSARDARGARAPAHDAPRARTAAHDAPGVGAAAGSESTFVSRANAVCVAADAFIATEPRPTSHALAIKDAATSIGYLLKTELPRLEAIVPPVSLAAGYASAINDSKQAINLIVDQGIPSLAVSLRVFIKDVESLDAEANRTAIALGLPACAVDPVAQ